jgi:hypothetical protein
MAPGSVESDSDNHSATDAHFKRHTPVPVKN